MTLFITHVSYLVTLLIVALIAMIMYKKSRWDYKPMLLFFIMLFVFETLIFLSGGNKPAANFLGNLKLFLETVLILWQAQRWGVFGKPKTQFILLGVFVLVLLIEKLVLNNIGIYSGAHRIYSCLLIIFIAIEMLLGNLIGKVNPTYKNSIVQFSLALILYYLVAALLEVFTAIGVNATQDTARFAYFIVISLGFLTNIIYLRTLLCIPQKAML